MSGARRRYVRTLGTTLISLTVSAAVLAVPGEATAAGPGVCQGVSRCRVVARVDVNGDGRRDAVGVAKRGPDASPDGAVIVRVKTGPGRIVSARRRLEPWFGSPWHGAALLDGRKGAELVVGHLTGAHTQFFHALTWRRGRLVTLPPPDGDPDWVVDGAWSVALGWQRRTTDPIGTLRRLEAHRNGQSHTFTGTITSYRWSHGRWVRGTSVRDDRLDEDHAATWGGFQIPGLPRF